MHRSPFRTFTTVVLTLSVAACSESSGSPAQPPAPDLPTIPGVVLRYGGERVPFAPLAAACDDATMDRRRAESRAREPFSIDWTAAERAAARADLARRVYSVQTVPDTTTGWLVDTAAAANHVRFRRGEVQLGLRAGVAVGDIQGSLVAVGATSVTVPAPPSGLANTARVAVVRGAERQAVLALLSDCRLRYVELAAPSLTAQFALGGW